jgi:phosphoribosyl-ATP pyrophosphohydrolase
LAEEVLMEKVIEEVSEFMDALSVRGQKSESGDELAVGVTAEIVGMRRRLGIKDVGESLSERHRRSTADPALKRA